MWGGVLRIIMHNSLGRPCLTPPAASYSTCQPGLPSTLADFSRKRKPSIDLSDRCRLLRAVGTPDSLIFFAVISNYHGDPFVWYFMELSRARQFCQ